jgi:hypothetical protein
VRPTTIAVIFALSAVTLGCSESSPVSPDRSTFQGQVSDPAGDAANDARVSPSPDLVSGSIEVEDATATFNIQFAPGRLDQTTSYAQVALDIDSNMATGHLLGDFGLGVEFLIDFVPESGGTVKVFRHDRATDLFETTGVVPRYNAGNGWSASVPLALLGGTDGRSAFRIVSSALIGPKTGVGILDYMPDRGTPFGVVR